MEVREYQIAALSTAGPYLRACEQFGDLSNDEQQDMLRLAYLALKLNGEAGEFAELTGKMLRDDIGWMKPERQEKMIFELGDVLWYCANIAECLGVSLETVMRMNSDKLADRQNRGVLTGDGDNR